MRVFRAEPLLEILAYIDERIAAGESIELAVIDPDHARGQFSGERIDGCVYRSWRTWHDLAERRGLRMRTSKPYEPADPDAPPMIALAFEPLVRTRPPRDPAALADSRERYGAESSFARIDKAEDPGFVLDLADALGRIEFPSAPRVLSLGINAGDEVALARALSPALATARFVGVDHSESALARARERFGAGVELHVADLNDLRLPLERFDLVLAINVLQSGNLDDRALLRRVVQGYLAPAGAVILGMPNCRYVDGEVEYGARMVNFRQPELGLLVKDVAFYRKYLQQHHRQVFVTGKHCVLVTAVAVQVAQ